MKRIVLWTVVFGIALNILGWLGNNLLLGDLWDQANADVKAGFAAPWPDVVREIITIISDFIFAFAMVWVFSNAQSKSVGFALKLAIVIWVAGPALFYLVMVNAGFLPVEISVKTSILALSTFLVAAPLLPAVFKEPRGGA